MKIPRLKLLTFQQCEVYIHYTSLGLTVPGSFLWTILGKTSDFKTEPPVHSLIVHFHPHAQFSLHSP